MQCPLCQHENPTGQKFCGECGARLAAPCPACGAPNTPGQKFCGECGAPLPVQPSQRFASPQAYTPKHLAEKILTSRSALEGERKQVTVLFVDVSGFTSLSEQLDPEDVHRFMSRGFELMLAEVHRYEGTVNQFLGDGIMALFGAPIAHEDHAQRALHAALGIRKTLDGYREEVQRQNGISFQLRQGLNTGLVVVGSIGSDLRMDYTAVGDTTNVAARLQQSADPGRIVVSEATHRLVEGYFYTRPLGELPLKGKAEQVRAWEVISARMARTRLEVEAESGLTPYVGRDRELRLLSECFEKVKAGHGRVVFLVGEPGIGKSRLLYEFRGRLGDEATWLEGHSIPFGQSIAFHPLIDLLKRTFRIEEDDAEAAIVEKIERSVLLLGEDLRPTIPYIRFLLSVDPGDPAVTRMDPKQRRQGIFDALRRLLIRAAEVRPQVMVYEDIHWMDKTMEESLLFLADSIPTRPILQFLTYRPGYAHPFGEHTYHTRIALDTLSAEASVQMAQSILAAEGLPEELKALIVGKAEGNPFFVEEVVKSLREIGALRREGDRYIVSRRPDDIVVPDKIQDIIMARIDRLAEAPKKTVQLASVIGREFTRRLLDRISEIRERTEDVLRELKATELIYEKSLFPELAYMFKHALTHEVAYNSLLVQRRKELHRIVGLAIEELYADRLVEHYEVLAHHFSKAEQRAKALEYLVKAGDKASAAFANREAVSLYEQALELLGEDNLAQKADLLQRLATIYLHLVDPDASRHCAERGLALYEKLGDRRKMVAMHLHLHFVYTWQWDGAREDLGLKHVEAAAAIAEGDPDSVEKGLVYQRIGHGYLHRCQPVNTLAWAQRAVDLFRRLNVPMGTSLGTALTYTGRIAEGIGYNEKNWEFVLKAANPLIMAVFGHDLSLTLALVKDVSRAREWGERVLPHVVKASPNFEAMIQRPLALIYTLAGDVAKAEDACRSVEQIESRTLLGCIFEDAAAVGFYYLRRGAWDKAAEYLETASQRHEDRYTITAISGCALALGSLRLQTGDCPRAESLLRRSLDLCRSGGNVLFELWVLPALVELYLAMGDLGKAAEQVTRGFELLTPDQNWYGLPAAMYLTKGTLAAAGRRWDEAERSFAEAVAINRRYQLPWDEAKTLYEWGLMHVAGGRAGDRDTACTKLDAALELFRRIEAKRDIEKVLAVKAQLGG
jgi:class 3 adenylate cyclase/tetratricopeptide (TPR) repeat protein